MAQPTWTGFLIALTLVGFFVGIFGLLYSDIENKYGADYQNDSLAVYNKLNEMHIEAKSYQANISLVGGEKGLFEKGVDVFGGIFSAGWSSLKITFKSVQVFIGMADSATDELAEAGIDETAKHLRAMIITVVLILIFIGIALPVILRWGKKI
jgi:hypothetical protein